MILSMYLWYAITSHSSNNEILLIILKKRQVITNPNSVGFSLQNHLFDLKLTFVPKRTNWKKLYDL